MSGCKYNTTSVKQTDVTFQKRNMVNGRQIKIIIMSQITKHIDINGLPGNRTPWNKFIIWHTGIPWVVFFSGFFSYAWAIGFRKNRWEGRAIDGGWWSTNERTNDVRTAPLEIRSISKCARALLRVIVQLNEWLFRDEKHG